MPVVHHASPLVLTLGSILVIGRLRVAFISPELSTFLAPALLLPLYPLSRWRRFGEIGLATLVAGGLLPIITRYMEHSDADDGA